VERRRDRRTLVEHREAVSEPSAGCSAGDRLHTSDKLQTSEEATEARPSGQVADCCWHLQVLGCKGLRADFAARSK
jgi:hypothetical protein